MGGVRRQVVSLIEIAALSFVGVEEFDSVMSMPKRNYREFVTYKQRFERLQPLFWLLWKLNRVPKGCYEKFCKP